MINWFKKSEEWFEKHPVISGVIEFLFLISIAAWGWLFLVVFS